MSFSCVDKVVEDKPGHPEYGSARHCAVDEVALQSGDVGDWKVRERAIFKVDIEFPVCATEIGLDGCLGYNGFRHKIFMRKAYAFGNASGTAGIEQCGHPSLQDLTIGDYFPRKLPYFRQVVAAPVGGRA